MMQNLVQNVASYLYEVLGVSVLPESWPASDRLPFYLRETYQFFHCHLFDTPCLLMCDRTTCAINPVTVGKHIMQVRRQWEGEVVYLCAGIAPYVRKRFIAQKIPFVVPGNQLYLPSFGMDLREYYKKLRPPVTAVSPSAQAAILQALRHVGEQPFTPSTLAKRLGYTRMTMARAFDELAALDLGEIVSAGKERQWHIPQGAQALWQHARGVMRSPVKKRVWTVAPAIAWPGTPAGLTALASSTLLAPPARPVYAMSAAEWRAWRQDCPDMPVFARPEEDAQSYEVELWSYAPRLFAEYNRVDPFSLYLSLSSQEDERVQIALAQLMEQVTWS